MNYATIRVTPIAGALGAEISGIDLAAPPDAETFAEIKRALLDHLVIVLRHQAVPPAAFLDFARRFGVALPHAYLKGLDGFPEILQIITEADDREVFAAGWHADLTYREKPILGALLHAREVPPWGGDTLFANQYLAYESLSPGLRALIDGLSAVHGNALMGVHGRSNQAAMTDADGGIDSIAASEVVHPMVRTHPETGRKALFVNPRYVIRIEDMSEAESRPLLDTLLARAVLPQFTCRLRWSQHMIAMWDNRCTLHAPVADYFGHRRRMHRITIEGDRPR